MRRLLGFTSDLMRAHAGRMLPFKLTYVVTDNCSCRCAVCLLWKEPRAGANTSTVERLFRANPHLSWINLSGGEVVERDDFVHLVTLAVKHTRVYALDFPTAGQCPDLIESRVREVLRLPLPRLVVTVSLDGPPEVHDRLRGIQGAFNRARETFERLRALRHPRLRVVAGLTLSSRNDSDPEQLVQLLLKEAPFLSREDLHFNLAHHAPHVYFNQPGDTPDRRRASAFMANEGRKRSLRADPLAFLERAYWKLAPEYLATGKSPLSCTALRSSAYVDPDLTLFPCASWDQPLLNLADVDYSLEKATEQLRVREAREQARERSCPGCWTPCEAYPTLLSHIPTALLRRSATKTTTPDPVPAGKAEACGKA